MFFARPVSTIGCDVLPVLRWRKQKDKCYLIVFVLCWQRAINYFRWLHPTAQGRFLSSSVTSNWETSVKFKAGNLMPPNGTAKFLMWQKGEIVNFLIKIHDWKAAILTVFNIFSYCTWKLKSDLHFIWSTAFVVKLFACHSKIKCNFGSGKN